MLNEKAEYLQYTADPSKCTRLSSLKSGNQTVGLDRAMLTVARAAAFAPDGSFSEEKGIEELQAWCGFTGEESFLKGFFTQEKWRKVILPKKYRYEKDMYSSDLSRNSFREITYERILADAFEAGPLKRYYLVCERDFFEDCVFVCRTEKKKTERSLRYVSGKNKNACNKSVNSILKVTACYLLSKAEDSEIACINQTALVNWGTVSPQTFANYFYENKPLYRKENLNSNITLLRMPEKWYKHFSVVESGELSRFPPEEYVFWSDNGGGNKDDYLAFGIKYNL